MARRTYKTQAYFVAYDCFRYLSKYRDKIFPSLDTEEKLEWDALIDQTQSFILLFPKPTVEPDAGP